MPLTASVMNDLPEMPQCTDIKTMVSEVKFMARGADQHHQEQRVNATNRTTRNWDDEMARQMAPRQNLTFYIQGLTMSLNQTYCMVSEVKTEQLRAKTNP
jgi:hypothetical protein